MIWLEWRFPQMGKDAEMFLPPAGLKKKEATEPLPMEVDAYERFRTEFMLPLWWPVCQ